MPKKRDEPKLTPEQESRIEALSAITPEDIEDARAAWKLDAPKAFRDLLDARSVADGES